MWPTVYVSWLDLNMRLWRLALSSASVMSHRLDPTRFDMSDHPEFPRMAFEKSEAMGLSLINAAFAQQRILMRAFRPENAFGDWMSVYGAALRPFETKAHGNARRLRR
jgi:hypothetical protein